MIAMADLAVEAVQQFYSADPEEVSNSDVEFIPFVVSTDIDLEELRKKSYVEEHDIS